MFSGIRRRGASEATRRLEEQAARARRIAEGQRRDAARTIAATEALLRAARTRT